MTDNEAFLKRKKAQVYEVATKYNEAQKALNMAEDAVIEARAKVVNLNTWGRALTLELEELEKAVAVENEATK